MLYFVMNPNSQSSYGKLMWSKILQELEDQGIRYQCLKTKRPKDATRIAKKLTMGTAKRKIVILGGDGTLNEFLNGMQRTEGIEIGYLPLGSGNDFARGMGISKDYKKELEKILDGSQKRYVDYGIMTNSKGEEIRFFVSCGYGYNAEVCYGVGHSKIKAILNRVKLGKLCYLVIGVRDLFRAKNYYASLTVDGKEVLFGDGFLLTAFQNQRFEGGGFLFCPDADPCDGYLDICVAKGIPKWKLPFILPLALVGKHVNCKGVSVYQCKEAYIRTHKKQYVHTDGESRENDKKINIRVSDEKVVFVN